MGKLANRTALVTGAGQGIGRATAVKFAREGATLVINDLDAENLAETVRLVEAEGQRVHALPGDVTKAAFPEAFTSLAMSATGRLDILVNNAGYTWDSVIHKTSDDQWSRVLSVHLDAPFRLLRAAQPHFKKQALDDRAAGHRTVRKVVNISSVAGLFGNAGQSPYATAKAGILGLTQTLAKEWGRYDVAVNAVAFALIDTRLVADVADGEEMEIDGERIRVGIHSDLLARMVDTVPLGRVGTVEEAAGAIALLCYPESDYISGQTLLCSGGLTGI